MAPSDTFEFEDTSTAEQLTGLGVSISRMANAKGKTMGKDGLVKLLKRARNVLESAAQTNEKECKASSKIAASLIERLFIDHSDQDVKALVASCLSHVLRLHVSACPYTPQQQRTIFTLFMWVIRKLDDPVSTSFSLTQSTFNVIHQTKCCLLLLDLEDEDFLSDFVRVLFGSVNSRNAEEVGGSVLEILSMLVEEADDVSPAVLDAIICGLLSQEEAASSIARRLVQEQEALLRPHLQRHLLAIVTQDTDSDALDNGPELMLQIQRASPRVLLPVIQALAAQLRVPSEEARCATIALVGGLLSSPDALANDQFPGLFLAFLERANDVKASVRSAFVQQCSKVLLTCTNEHDRQQLVDMLVSKLMDVDEVVRVEAVEAIAAVALKRLSNLGEDQHALTQVAGRLRDAKPAVRQVAATCLLSLYRCSIAMYNGEEPLAWIPSCLLLQAALERNFGAMLLNSASLLRDGLLPLKTPNDAAARHWVALYQEASGPARAAIQRLLAARDLVQQEVVKMAGARAQRAAAADDASAAHAQRSLERYVRRVAAVAQLGDTSKAEEALLKLADLKDNHIFKSLVALCAPGASREACRKHSKEVQSRTSGRGAVSTITAAVCRRVTQMLLAPEHLGHLLTMMSQANAREPPAFAAALADLLSDTAAAAPRLFAGQGPLLVQLVSGSDDAASSVAVQVLADAGPCISAAAADQGAQFPSDACLEALLDRVSATSADTAKTAVRAITALYGHSAAPGHLKATITKMVDDLAPPRTVKAANKIKASVAAISMAVRLMPESFGHAAQATAAFVIGELMQAGLPNKQPIQPARHHRLGLEVSFMVNVKLAALKAVARMCTPWQPHNRRQQPDDTTCDGTFGGAIISEVLEMLLPHLPPLLLLPSSPSEDDTPRQYLLSPEGVDDRAAVRWAAGTALLRLARSHDGALPVAEFHAVSLMLSDPEPQARVAFIRKLCHSIRHFQVCRRASRAAKFASLLFLCGQDPEVENQEAAMKLLHHFVTTTRRSAAAAAAAAAAQREGGGTLMQEHPEFMLPFAVHLLAHHPDCPSPEEADADDERLLPFVAMLQFGLEPLLLGPSAAPTGVASAMGGRGMVTTLLRTIRRAVDAMDTPLTDNTRMLAELGLQVADSITAVAAPKASSNPRQDANDWGHMFGDVPLPQKLYNNAPASAPKPGSLLPQGLEIQVDTLFNSPPPTSKIKGDAQQCRQDSTKHISPMTEGKNDPLSTPARPHRGTNSSPGPRQTPSSAGNVKKQRVQQVDARGPDDRITPLRSPPSSTDKASKHHYHPSQDTAARSPAVEPQQRDKPARKPRGRKAAAQPKKPSNAKQARNLGVAKANPKSRRQQPRRGAKAAAQDRLADTTMSESG